MSSRIARCLECGEHKPFEEMASIDCDRTGMCKACSSDIPERKNRLSELLVEEMKEAFIHGEHLLKGEARKKAIDKRVNNIFEKLKKEGLVLSRRKDED